MKTVNKLAALWSLLIISLCFAPAWLPINAQQPAGVAVSVNNVQLVIEGKVISVHDGDTVTVLDQDNKKYNIRLQGIDAPELKQEFGAASQKNLSGMVLGKQVSIYWNKVDKYRRTVGTIMLDGRDINIEQVKAGVAWHFKKYEDEQSPTDRRTYAAAEQAARAAKLGLWQKENPLPPGDWRQEVKIKRWGPPPPEGTIIGSANSKKYHRPDCPGYRDMAERNRVFFKSVDEAEAAGFKRAGNCPAELVAIRATPARTPIAPVSSVADSRPTTIVQSAQQSLKIVGNKNSKSFHLPSCPGYKQVAEKNRVFFASVAEAEAAGYKRAGNCPAETAEVKITPAPSPEASAVATTQPSASTQPATALSLPVTTAIEPGSTVVEGDRPKVESGQALKIVGNKNSKIFHQPWCSGYERVGEKNRVFFASVTEAEAAGFKRAGNCRAEPAAVKTARASSPGVTTSSNAAVTTATQPATVPPVPVATNIKAAPALVADGQIKVESSQSSLKIVGNKNSKIFHQPWCSGYDRVSEKNRVYFNSSAEAETAGYRIAKNCAATNPN